MSSANGADALARIGERAAEHRYAEAWAVARDAMAQRPKDVAVVGAGGSVLFEWGRVREARARLQVAGEAGALSPSALVQLGWTCLWTGDAPAAERWMRDAVAKAPDRWEAHLGLAAALRALRRTEAAIAECHAALALAPGNSVCHAEIYNCLIDAGRLEEALNAARLAADAHPHDVDLLANLAAALMWLDRFADASAVYDRIAALQESRSNAAQLPVDAAFARQECGRVDDALALYGRLLSVDASAESLVKYSFALLAGGSLREGFHFYEFRRLLKPTPLPPIDARRPRWAGQPLQGKTVALVAEQGIGDTIQFVRYAALLKAQGARVLLQGAPEYEALAKGVVALDGTVPAHAPPVGVDYVVPTLSAGAVCATTLDSIPNAIPYIEVDPERASRWRARLGPSMTLNVGLAWTGSPAHRRDRYRSIPLNRLEPLFGIPGVRIVSLQKGQALEQIKGFPAASEMLNLGPELHDLADTAAVIDQLDLVIGVDTAVIHLAGAMGRPVWALIASPSDWRWLVDREDSPWYPTMRLFRQTVQDDWSGVIASVAAALRDFATTRSSAPRVPTLTPPRAMAFPDVAFVEARHGMFHCRHRGSPGERSLSYYGEYQERQLDLLRRTLSPGASILEAGSGAGVHTVPLGAISGPEGHLFACEAREPMTGLLRNNLMANEVRGVTTLRTTLAGSGGDRIDDATATVDDLGLDRLDCLKINDGLDPEPILLGAERTLWEQRCIVLASVPDDGAARRVAAGLTGFGYHCVEVRVPLFDLGNFNRRDDDIFAGAVSVSVLAIPEESAAVAVADGLPVLQ